MIRSAGLALLLSTMPLAAVTRAAADRAEHVLYDAGVAIARSLPSMSVAGGAPGGRLSDTGVPDVVTESGPELIALAGSGAKPAKRSHGGRHAATDISVYVGERKLLELARSGVVPTGRSVPADSARPAGIALSGVSVYGVGLRDGDVLTAVEGHPVLAESQVVGVVIGVLSRHERKITGEFWRGARHGSIVVEFPVVRLSLNDR